MYLINPGVRRSSLVKKDAGMLDAFGKGASEDIQAAKSELYAQVRSWSVTMRITRPV